MKMAEGHFINPSEFIGRTPKKALKRPLFQYITSAVVEGPYPGGMLAVSGFLSKKRHIFGFFPKNAPFSLLKGVFCLFFFNYCPKTVQKGCFWGFGRPSKRP